MPDPLPRDPDAWDSDAVGPEDVAARCERVAEVAALLQRRDLADKLAAAAARTTSPCTVLMVVGEFKQGKSSLVNGLVGRNVCPVDDDLATSVVTAVHAAPQLSVVARRREDGRSVAVDVDPDELTLLVTERGNPDNRAGIERVDIGVPSPLLEAGVVVVDSPGVGGIGPANAAATMSFLPLADAVLFVTDSTSELSAPELDFLEDAVTRCPAVVVVQTKTDLSPSWRRIAALNEGHLERRQIDAPLVSVSSALREVALRRGDAALNDRSGFPALLTLLDAGLVSDARATAASRAVAEAADAVVQLRSVVEAELLALADPSHVARAVEDARQAELRLAGLESAGARWSQVLNEALADLTNRVSFDFRERQRRLQRDLDARIEAATTGWEQILDEAKAAVAAEVAASYSTVTDGARAAVDAVDVLLAGELGLAWTGSARTYDVATLADGEVRDESGGAVRVAASGVGQAVGALKGLQGGVMLLGMLGMLFPAIAISTPIMLGVGSAFGVKNVVDQRKRRVSEARAATRQAVRQLLDEVSFKVGTDIGATTKLVQQQVREDVSARVAELLRTAQDRAARSAEAAASSGRERADRVEAVERAAALLQALERELGGVVAA